MCTHTHSFATIPVIQHRSKFDSSKLKHLPWTWRHLDGRTHRGGKQNLPVAAPRPLLWLFFYFKTSTFSLSKTHGKPINMKYTSSSIDSTAEPPCCTENSPSLISVTRGSGEDTTYHFNKDSERFKDISTQELASQEIHLLNTYCDLQMRCIASINYNANWSFYFRFDFFNGELMVHKNS